MSRKRSKKGKRKKGKKNLRGINSPLQMWIKNSFQVVMITSLPLGYTILVRSHAKCYSILTRASEGIEWITGGRGGEWGERKREKGRRRRRKAMSFQNNVASMLFHINQKKRRRRRKKKRKHRKSPPDHLTLKPTTARELIWHRS